MIHIPVLLKEVTAFLNVLPGKLYIDATVGAGGHSQQIIRLGGVVLGLDCDAQILQGTRKLLPKAEIEKANFTEIDQVAKAGGFQRVDGILYDLGVSSFQFDTVARGFSFRKDAPLDMRMDEELAVSAADLVNALNSGELTELFTKLGEEKEARQIARAIVNRRAIKKIETTTELADLVRSIKRKSGKKIHPATQVFQALRIAVNDELNNLRDSLPKAADLLNPGGRLVVISFHSLEEKIVKDFINSRRDLLSLTEKPIVPTENEVALNPRSRSAKLRAVEKVG